MRSVGIEVTVPTKERPAASVVVLEGDWNNHTLADEFPLTSNAGSIPTIILELAKGLTSALTGLKADRIVIRLADYSTASNKRGPKLRLMAEGALVAAARAECVDVIAEDGRMLAGHAGVTNKAALDRAGAALGSISEHAAAAALAGLVP